MSSSVAKPIIKQIKDRQDALDFFEHVSLPKEDEKTQEIIMNFPTVYIHNWQESGDFEVYVGESNDIFKRTRQHYDAASDNSKWQSKLLEKDASLFIIGHEHFNKSLTLDIENRLMHYMMSVDRVKHVHNLRDNPQTSYYPMEELDEIFSKIWRGLRKENKELFRDAVLLASQKLEVSEDIVEKDYYVTMILKKLSAIEYPIVFKGGTSLSKAFQIIDRFSEDIDITFTEHLGEARRKKLKYNILKPIADDLGVEIRNFESIESDKNLNYYDFLRLVGEVRNHRLNMGAAIAPSVPLDVNILELAQSICDEDFYKNDYKETTLKLISDSLSYEQVKKRYKELVEKILHKENQNA